MDWPKQKWPKCFAQDIVGRKVVFPSKIGTKGAHELP